MEINKNFLSEIGSKAIELATMPKVELPDLSFVQNIVAKPPKIEIDEESTFAYQLQQQTNQIIEKSNEQINLLMQHNEQLTNNYQKLEELYSLKEKELNEAKADAKKAKRYNAIMMVISVVSMLTAVAAWLLPNILGGVS